jgi:hypothetical protein
MTNLLQTRKKAVELRLLVSQRFRWLMVGLRIEQKQLSAKESQRIGST